MKKNWKETLKLWLGALLIPFAVVAEAVSTGCKKLRTLPKKAVALCVAAALIVAMIPVAVGAAETTNYDIWVEGTQVTSENQSNVLGKTGWSGATVTYDPTTNTLTLNYAALKSSNGTYNYYGSRYVICFGANAPANPILMVNGICSIVAESSDKTIIGIGAPQVNLTIQKANSSSTLGIQVESTKEYNHSSSAYGIEAGNQLIFDGANVSVVTNGTARLTNGIFVMNYNSPVVTVKNNAYLNLSASGTATNNYALDYNAGGTLTIDDTSTAIFQSDDADCIGTGISLNQDSEGNYTQIILADANKDGVMETHTSKPRNPYASRIEVHPAVKVTLDLSSAGGTSQALYWAKGVKFPEPSAPSIKGYVFEGWYTSSNYTTAFNFNQNLNTNTTIYAKFADYEGDKKALQDAVDALEADVAQLNKLTENGGTIDQINAKISTIESQIAALDALKNKYAEADTALKQELQAADAAINAAIAALTTRVQDLEADLAAAKSDISTNTSKVAQLTAELASLNASLTDLSNKLTNDYATKAELASAINSAKDTINSAIAALTTRVQDLEAGLAAAKSDISTNTSKVAELTAELAALNASLTDLSNKLTNDYATKAELTSAINSAKDTINSAIAALTVRVQDLEAGLAAAKSDISTNTSKVAELTAELAALNASLTDLSNKLTNDYATKAELTSAINSAKDTINSAIAALTVRVQDLEAGLAAANSKVDTNTSDVTALKSDVAALNTWKDQSQSTIAALETLTATQSADIARLKTAVQDLEAALAAAEARIDDAEDRIAALEGKVSALEIAKQNLDAAVAALNAAINNKADTATLNQKVTDLIAAIAAAEDAAKTYADGKDTALQTQLTAAIATAKGEAITAAENLVNTAKAELQTAINNKADIATLNAKVSELNAAIATAEATAKAYTDSAVTTLNAAIITAKDEAVDAAKDLVDAAKAQLQAAIDNKADAAAVNAAIANLQNAITALQNAKDNYIAADAALKAELEEKIAKAKQEAIDAAKGHIPYIGTNGNWWIGDTDTGVDANGIKGDTGNGIASITTKKENGVTTVTITFTDPETEPVVFTISDGETGATGADGVGVAKVEKTATNGNVDTYTVTLTNGKTYTFTVTNGKDGADGKDGENGKDGADGKDGLTPFIGENGNWWIGDTDTGVKAVAEQTAQKGTDTVTVVSIVVASVALLSNLALVVWIVTKKKKVLV